MSEGLFGNLFADLDTSFLKSKRGLLKVAQMVSISAQSIRFNVCLFFFPPQVCNRSGSRANHMKWDVDFLNAPASKTGFDFNGNIKSEVTMKSLPEVIILVVVKDSCCKSLS